MLGKLVFVSATAALSAGGAFAETYDYTLLDAPGSVLTIPSGINDSGVVLGDYSLAGGGDLGFIYSGGTYTTLGYPGSTSTEPEGISDSGAVVGAYGLQGGGGFGFLYSNGTYTEIRYPNSGATIAWGVNASGVIGGDYTHKGEFLSGFVDSGGSFTRIKIPDSKTFVSGINPSGAVAGYSIKQGTSQEIGFVESGGTYTQIMYPGSSDTAVLAISPSEVLAGYYARKGEYYGFAYSDGTYTRLNFPGSTLTQAIAINASGVVAGDYDKNGESYGFVYSDGTYTSINAAGWDGAYVTGINASGEVTGYYYDAADDTDFGFIATPQSAAFDVRPSSVVSAPEPSTWATLLVGFAGLGFVGYRRARERSGNFRKSGPPASIHCPIPFRAFSDHAEPLLCVQHRASADLVGSNGRARSRPRKPVERRASFQTPYGGVGPGWGVAPSQIE